MAGSLNKVMLIGNLGADPEVRTFANGGKVCNLRIATSETWRDKETGERRNKTEWHAVAIFSEGLRKVCERYLKKGSKVFIEGQLQTRKWQDQNGNNRYATEVVIRNFNGTLTMLGRDNFNENNNYKPPPSNEDSQQNSKQTSRSNRTSIDNDLESNTPTSNDFDDEIPF